ncbi:MAG: hypothetical protein ABUL66_00940, partial [Verrucomicrobiota bacterium]
PCNFPQMPHREYESYWIFTDNTNGVVQADHLTVAYGHDGDSFRSMQEGPIQGSISFSGGQLDVQLQFPWFSDSGHIDRYQNFCLNGTYKVWPE